MAVKEWSPNHQTAKELARLLSFTLSFIITSRGCPGNAVGKESACNAEDSGSILGWGRSPGEGNGNPLQYSCLENPMEQRSLVGYSAWGHKESDTTEAT